MGETIVRGFGILILMWNVTYPMVLLHLNRHEVLYRIVLIQQAIGLLGESWLYFSLPAEQINLRTIGLRFILFDGGGLAVMGGPFCS